MNIVEREHIELWSSLTSADDDDVEVRRGQSGLENKEIWAPSAL